MFIKFTFHSKTSI